MVTIGLSRTVSEINGDIRRKSPIFPPPMYLTPPLKGFPWNFVSAQGSQETRVMGLSDGRKSFQIGLAVLIQYRSVTDTHLASQTRCRSYYAQRQGVEPKNQETEHTKNKNNDIHPGNGVVYCYYPRAHTGRPVDETVYD